MKKVIKPIKCYKGFNSKLQYAAMKKVIKPIKCYKGFNSKLQCRGFQFEIGKEYELPEGEKPKACCSGFHACPSPADLFNFYAPNDGNRYCEVELSGYVDDSKSDKLTASKIKIIREVSLNEIAEAHREYVEKHTNGEQKVHNTVDYSSASNTVYRSSVSNTGNHSSANNTGDYSVASNTGHYSSASNTGHLSIASNTGHYSIASNKGNQSIASNTGHYSIASNTGDFSIASNTGDYSSASNTGCYSSASNTGDFSIASNTGRQSAASNIGHQSSAEVSGKASCAAVFGKDCRVRGAIGCGLFLTERGKWDGEKCPIKNVLAVIVDGKKVKANTWYKLVDGKLTECE